MSNKTIRAALAAALLVLGACSFTDEALVPSLSGEESTAQGPALGTNSFEPGGVTPGQPTGTYVGQKVEELRGDLARLQGAISEQNARLQGIRDQTRTNANGYHTTIGAINSKLQAGTTPGNPILVDQWGQAQAQLEAVNVDLGNMNQLANEVANSAALAGYMLETTRASFGISGAVDEDHRQLAILEDETNRTTVLIDRLLTELTDDIVRTTTYLGNERANLTTLASSINTGELYGTSFASRLYGVPLQAAAPGAGIASGRPLVVIRFDQQNVDYEQALFSAVSQALDRRPTAAFDLVAVSPATGDAASATLAANEARRDAEAVLRSLTSMGLPPERVSLSSAQSPAASSNEVHLYVR